MNCRVIVRRIARELIPAPTLGRLVYVKRAITGPRQQAIADMARLSQRVLSPAMHLRLRRTALKVLGRPTSAPVVRLPVSGAVPEIESSAGKPMPKPKPVISRERKLTGPFYFRGQSYGTMEALHAAEGAIKVDMAIASAFLGRHQVLDMMATEATSLPGGYSTLVCLVGSSDEDGAYLREVTARNPHVLGMLGKNSPVGRKWQSTVDLIRAACDFQLLGITGSDDILPAGLITAMIDRHRVCCSHDSIRPFATSLYGTMEWLIFSDAARDTLSPQLVKCSYKLDSALMPLGAGRFYSRQVIDHFDGDLFEVSQSRLLDDKGFYKVHNSGLGVEYYNAERGAVLSIKGDWGQMNSFEAIIQAPTVHVSDASFEGYEILRRQLTPATFERLFGGQPPQGAKLKGRRPDY